MRFLKYTVCILGFVASLANAASITGVYNAGSWIPTSLPNSGVAQGAYFTVTGSGLGPAALVVAPSYPLPTTAGLGGTVVQVKVGSVTSTCIMYYTSAGHSVGHAYGRRHAHGYLSGCECDQPDPGGHGFVRHVYFE